MLVAVLCLLALAPTASAATRTQILRDCEDDDKLSGTYTVKELRDAQNNINSGLDTYSKCRDVLSAALAADARRRSAAANATPGGGAGGTGAVATGGGGAAGTGATGPGDALTATGETRTTLGRDPGAPPADASPEEARELRAAREALPEVEMRGQRVVPGIRGAAGSSATATFPVSLGIVLGLLALSALLAAVPAVRRRVLARRAG
jgi:hypothetical protein